MVKTGKWIGEGWELVKQDLWMQVVVFLIYALISSASGGILAPAMMCGYFYILFKKMRNPAEPIQIADIFKGFEVFVPALVAGLIIGAFTSIGSMLCVLPGIVVSACLVYTYPLIMDRRMDFWPAIMESWEKTKTEWLGFSLFTLVCGLLYMAGAIACVVGILITGPIIIAAFAVAYRDIWGLSGEQPKPAFQASAAPAAPAAPSAPSEPRGSMPDTPAAPTESTSDSGMAEL